MNFKIIGEPRTKKNSPRIFMNKRTGKPIFLPSLASEDWTSIAVRQLLEQGADLLSLEVPLNMRAIFYRSREKGDLDNYIHAACDALEKVGAVVNDKWIRQYDGSRLRIDTVVPRVEISLTFL